MLCNQNGTEASNDAVGYFRCWRASHSPQEETMKQVLPIHRRIATGYDTKKEADTR